MPSRLRAGLVHDALRLADRGQPRADHRGLPPGDGERDEKRALDLGLISGLVQYGWILGNSAVLHPDPAEQAWAREELAWWVPRVRAALEATGVA